MAKPPPPPTPAEVCQEVGHDWVEHYNDEREIVGRICVRCGREEGRRS
jgi:hypothetical protein